MEEESNQIPETPASTHASLIDSSSVSQFLSVLSTRVDPAAAKASLRVTPHGLFVERNFLNDFFALYKTWFREKLGREAALSLQKCMKKFFNTPVPPLFYLVEAKQCMLGHLVRREYQDPKRLGLPTYLGTVDDTRRMLHPRDPLLMYMTNLEVKQGARGREFVLKCGKGQWTFDENVLLEFSRLVQRSPHLAKRFPNRTGALRDSFKALSEVLEQAKLAPPRQRLLVPEAFKAGRDINYIADGTLTFLLEGRNRIVWCYEVGGKTLFRFIKRECIGLFTSQDRRHRSRIEILPPRSRDLAAYQHKGKTFMLHPRAFLEFIRIVMHSPIEGSSLQFRYSVKDCLDELYRILEITEPISPDKVARHLERIRSKRILCLITSRWILAVTQRNRIIACIDRHHSHSRPKVNRGGNQGRKGDRRRFRGTR